MFAKCIGIYKIIDFIIDVSSKIYEFFLKSLVFD